MNKLNNQSGYIALVAVIILASLGLAVAVTVSLNGINELGLSWQNYQVERAFTLADSCAEEALLRLSRETSDYLGTHILNFEADSCTIEASADSSGYLVKITSLAQNKYYRHLKLTTDFDGVLTSWQLWDGD